ncbi:MAG: DUF3105 domain-containing protein [Pseudonocardiales bacterium]|nr:DUF3105 domain-containing protein [Pseudonocardiales bacterium]
MASGKTSKRARSARTVAVTQRTIPWGTIIATAVVLLFAAGVLGYAIVQQRAKSVATAAVAAFTPSETNQDPSKAIPGVVTAAFVGGKHVLPTDRVAYTHSPPFGGAHEFSWAACSGVVYPKPVRNENMVHSLEHGAVWIAYDPTKISGDQLAQLRRRVDGEQYTMLSPYPGLDQPISLQSWGHQLKLSDPADVRIDQFIQALRVNRFTHPEPGASCDALGPGQFDQDNPPPFDPKPPGPGAVPENGKPVGTASGEQLQNPTPTR